MIQDQLEQDFKKAMKEKDETAVSALRNLKAQIKNVEIENQKPLTDEEVISVIAKKVKQHKDSIESFKTGNRSDLVEVEEKQMAVLAGYLPQQMSEDEVRAVVKEVAAGAGPADFGRVMKEVMAKAKGRTDGAVVSKIVKEILG